MSEKQPDRPLTVCVTFEFDALALWSGMLGTQDPAQLSRGEFAAVAAPRILDYLREQEIPTTWGAPGQSLLAFPDVAKRVRDEGHEFVHHGWAHEKMSLYDADGQREILDKGLEAFDQVLGLRPQGYRAPAFEFAPDTPQLLEEYGFTFDSSFAGDDYNAYYMRSGDVASRTEPYVFGSPMDLVELPASWTIMDIPCFEFMWGVLPGLRAPSTVEEIWREDFDYALERNPGGVFIITLHPQSIGRGHRWLMIERLIEHFRSTGRVQFETLGAYADRWRAEHDYATYCATPSVHNPTPN